jgi:hypothetical protein
MQHFAVTELLDLHQHVFLDGHIQPFAFRQLGIFRIDDPPNRLRMLKPLADDRHLGEILRMQQTLHRSAVRMATNHYITHREASYRELDRRNLTPTCRAVRRHDVPCVANYEQVAGVGVRDQVRINPRVGTGNGQRLRALAL